LFDDWIDGNSIGFDRLIYIEGGGLIPEGNLSKPYFLSFPRVWNSSYWNPKGQIGIGFSVRYVGSPLKNLQHASALGHNIHNYDVYDEEH